MSDLPYAIERRVPLCPNCGYELPCEVGVPVFEPLVSRCVACGAECRALFFTRQWHFDPRPMGVSPVTTTNG